jgi:hypothetical protein
MNGAASHPSPVAGTKTRGQRRRQHALRLAGIAFAAALAVAGGAGCGRSGQAATAAAAAFHPDAAAISAAALHPHSPATAPAGTVPGASSSPAPAAGYAGPHFDTPQQAMIYLAAAYNSDNITDLHYLTTPAAFSDLMRMRATAVNLHLSYCQRNPRGDYTCYFRHDYPASANQTGHGQAIFIAAPAVDPGWYMFRFSDCG